MPRSCLCGIIPTDTRAALRRTVLRLVLLAPGVLSVSPPAFALTKEQAIENCRATVGSPNVQACMQGKSGDREGNLKICRAGVQPKMKACVLAALNAANGRANVAIELHKNGKPKEIVAPGNALPAGFVAPPRTIADITAILDSEKPDAAALAKLKEDADDDPEKGASQADLADFYNDRAVARSQLGRNAEALADAQKALAAAKSAGDFYFTQRIQLLIASQKRALGDIKGTLQNNRTMVSEADRPGTKGYLFGALQSAAKILIEMGDIPQAEGLLRRNVALLAEARTSGLPGWRTNYPIKGRNWEGIVETHRAQVLEARGQFREFGSVLRQGTGMETRFDSGLQELRNTRRRNPSFAGPWTRTSSTSPG